jgi:hypothetical protein
MSHKAMLMIRSTYEALMHLYKMTAESLSAFIREVDRTYLEQLVEKHCRTLMTRFFPEIISLESLEDKSSKSPGSI